MKPVGRHTRFVVFILFLIHALSSSAITITSDTYIGPTDPSDDGQDIIVTNCTLTVDGMHGFNSLQILNSAVLTHSAFTNGPQGFTNLVSDENQTLSTNIPATLNNTNVNTNTIVVMDITATITYTPNVDYLVIDSNQFTQLTLTTNSSIAEGATVLVSYDWALVYQGFSLTISNNMDVAAGGAVDLSGMGYAGGNGFGNGVGTSESTNFPVSITIGGGGGHGGCGGTANVLVEAPGGLAAALVALGGASYDSTTNPADLGSGGGAGSGNGGAGGGLGQFFVGGALQLDGQIVADGLSGTNSAGGGAGGGLLLSAQTLSGAGSISAQGGSGDLSSGGGGGGIIAIYSATNMFTGSIVAYGGAGQHYGGAGTILNTGFTNGPGQLLIANNGVVGTNTTFFAPAISNLTISGGANAQPLNSTFAISNLFVGSNSALLPVSLTLTVNGNATVESNGFIDADSRSASGQGGGASSCGAGAGGSYGGTGGSSFCGSASGSAYDFNFETPTALGSPGGGSPAALGGGAINLTVAGMLSLAGQISANGGGGIATNGGGGSGGSVFLTVGTISGGGTIAANGGAANNPFGGGGGGGAVAVVFNTNLFTGPITAYGGAGANAGGAGTVYLKTNSGNAQIIVDNSGLTGGVTPLTTTFFGPDLTLRGGAILTNNAQSMGSVGNLFIGSNSFISGSFDPAFATTLTATTATIQSGGGFSLNAQSVSTLERGGSLDSTGGGGGNGGNGGMSASNAPGGVSTQSAFGGVSGLYPGSEGGFGQSGAGGYGGAELIFTVRGTLQLDGIISANGGTSTNLNSGGGAGGGIGLSVGTLIGTGTICANGGAANNLGGGGAGGKIAILYLTNSFAGNITAYGGPGAQYGGAGTIYQAQTTNIGGNAISQQILIDNGGMPGANTGLNDAGSFPGLFDLTIRGAASVSNGIPGGLTNGNLTVESNSTLMFGGTSQQVLNILTNSTIQAGGAIRADGIISTLSPTAGGSLNSTGGGGGYGGMGGPSALGAVGGGVIADAYASPTSVGAIGGGGVSFSGNGGGSLRLIVNGTLQLDGAVSAQGTTGSRTNTGGGSGGSIWLSAGTISGAGTISVNGGAANGAEGGGGGGGQIALYYNTNTFTGNLTAYGGAGANYGGAGSIYTASSFSGIPQFTSMLADNGGNPGQPTLLNGQSVALQVSDCKVRGGAFLGFTNAAVDAGFPLPIFGNLFIGSNSTYSSTYPIFTVLTNATVQIGGVLTIAPTGANGQFFTENGQSLNFIGGGGGHGGYGGLGLSGTNLPSAAGGNVGDTINPPVSGGGSGGFGSADASGGTGGGVLHVFVDGNLQLDGVCSADGAAALSAVNAGGGAGGGLWIVAGGLAGAGSISANGGAANGHGGGGGGGRVAIWVDTNLFAGTISARGGTGSQNGGAGTIYFNSNTNGTGSSKLVIDGGGSTGTNAGLLTGINGVDVLITNSGTLAVGANNMRWSSLTISTNSSLTLVSNFPTLNLTVSNNVTIQAGGSIDLDAEGFAANLGPGAAGFDPQSGGGGGHGGIGGPSTNEPGGSSYDSITQPLMAGSGGGFGFATNSAGGGAMQLTVLGSLDVDGSISANGGNGVPARTFSTGGGGAGGSLWILTPALSGAGTISANGGNGGTTNCGGGAGGRIAIDCFTAYAFTGTFSAHGGAGSAVSGGAGTIYLKTNSAVGQLFVDNGGSPATNTPLDSLVQPVVLSVSNGAVASSGTPITLQSLTIGSNAVFTANSQATLALTVLGNAFVDTNASITANGEGYNANSGPGSGLYITGEGSGGGYGGTGGNSLSGTSGGGTYGSSNQPVDFGSAGGVLDDLPGSSQGGGAIRLVVYGTLTANGNISANGIDALTNSAGGGSGGSIWITAQSLAGGGSLTANGGMGNSGQGGGGGGGRIAVYATANTFSGSSSAGGGNGAFPGQPGTIIVATNLLVSGSVTDTNGVGITGITLQPSGLSAVTTDSSGSYSVAAPLFWTGSVAPASAGFYLPNLRAYSNLSSNAPSQNYLLTLSTDFNINSTSFDGTNLNFSWYGINGVAYQPLYSSNLVNWLPYGPPFVGSNAPATFTLPVSTAPQLFFRLGVTYP